MTLNEIEFAIESRFERKSDAIDDAFIGGGMSQAEYDRQMKAAGAQVDRDYAEARKTFPQAFAKGN